MPCLLLFLLCFGPYCNAIFGCGRVCISRPAKSWTNLLGYVLLVCYAARVCANGGGSRGGGVLGPLGTMVPWGVSSKEGGAAHGPLHPAMHKSLETLMPLWFFLLVFVVVLVVFLLVCPALLVSRVGFCLVTEVIPFKTRPVSVLLFVSLFLFGVFAGDFVFFVFFVFSLSLSLSLSFFLLGAGKPTPLRGLGFPL